MYKKKYKDFFRLHRHNLEEIFYPIKKYYSKNAKPIKYVFFPKHGIILNNHDDQFSSITNFGKKFFFQIDYHKIRKVKLYIDENKFKEIWTCESDFIKYYFSHLRNKRICIKSNGSFKSIDLNKKENLEHDTYYLFLKKDYNFEQVIDSLLYIDWNNPPQEINFIKEKGIYYKKYKKEILDLGDESFKTFFHNAKVGMTLSVISNFINFYNEETRIFYFNCNYIYNSKAYLRKKYFLYFLNFLFFQNESEKAKNFLMKIYYNFTEYNNNLKNLLEESINLFKNEEEEAIYIIFDNIHSSEQYKFVNCIKSDINLYNENIFIREFIEINSDTLNILKDFFKKGKMVEILGKMESKSLKDDLNIILEVIKKKENYLQSYKENISNQLSILFKDYSLNQYLDLVKLFYYLNEKENTKNINFDELKDFNEFLYINISNDKIKIGFRNKIIEYLFKNYYIYYHDIFFNEESKHLIKELLQSEKGYNFERQIIFSIIIGKYKKIYNRVNVNRIYCLGKFENFKFDKNILFYQIISNAPIYDFAVLIKNKNGEYILKAYQVSINKGKNDLQKLEFDIIEYDLNYFIEKFYRITNIKITSFTFGIITSYQSYNNKDTNLQNISYFCIENKYELLLYDIEKNTIYINESRKKDQYNLREIKSFEEINNFDFKSYEIFKNGCKIPKKCYIEKIKPLSYRKYIKEAFTSLTNKDFELGFKLIGKFKSDISVFEQNEKDIVFIYSKKIKKEFVQVYYNNNKLYENEVEDNNDKDKKGKEEVLVLKIKNFLLLKGMDFSKFQKISLKINQEDEESNINYLVFEKDDNKEYYLEEEENEINEEENNSNLEESDEEIEDNDEIMTLEKLGLLNKNDFKSEFKEFVFKKDFNGYNYAIINNNFEPTKSSDFQNNQNDEEHSLSISDFSKSDCSIDEDIDSKEEKELIAKKIDFNSYEFRPMPINDEVYKGLINGDIEVYNSLINSAKGSKNHSVKPSPSSFLRMKRSNVFPLYKKEDKQKS